MSLTPRKSVQNSESNRYAVIQRVVDILRIRQVQIIVGLDVMSISNLDDDGCRKTADIG